MAGLAFRFDGRLSPLQRWDIRFRVAATAITSACVLAAPAWALPMLTAGSLTLLALARATPREVLRVVRSFSGFLLFFFGLGLLFEPTWARAGLLGIQAWRLTMLLLLGHCLFLTATPAAVTEGIRWYLGWLGPRRAWLAASMAGWALASVPLVLDQAAGLADAASLRGLNPRRHPLRMVKLLTLALLVRTVDRSLCLAEALEARGFGVSIPPLTLRARLRDSAALAGTTFWCAAAWVVGVILSS